MRMKMDGGGYSRPVSKPTYAKPAAMPARRPSPYLKTAADFAPKPPTKPPTKRRRPMVSFPKDMGFQVEAGVRSALGLGVR